MAPQQEKSSLKRARHSNNEVAEPKKPRRSARLSHLVDEGGEQMKQGALPSPVTRKVTSDDDAHDGDGKAVTVTPPADRHDGPPGQATPESSPAMASQRRHGLSSPPSDTQPFSQFLAPPPIAYEVADEEAEGVWGYLIPVDRVDDPLVLRRREHCPVSPKNLGQADGHRTVSKKHWREKEEGYEQEKCARGVTASGYLIGRHPECDRIIDVPTVSNRHCLVFNENRDGDTIAVLEDLSGNGTYVNDGYVGRNKRRELQDGDEVSILDQRRFIFRYPRRVGGNAFRQQYTIQGQLGKGHFATVYLATEKSTGDRFAVKKFEKRSGPGEKSKVEGLQQEIAVLMGVSHPGVLCLRDTFDDADGVYLVLELAAEGELFNWIVMKQRMTEAETRKIFIQLFQGVKYLHERNIVHRDIKPENVLLMDKNLTVKLADFGLAKIIGEESFTTTLCGTPSYVAPEILEQSNRRRYTRAVDVWSLGVVLYICLCGFPPFSDELYTPENPYTLSQQIKMGRFDYPSPYWDSVGDPALDLIDRMLTVDVAKRISIDDCLEHPWTTHRASAGPAPLGVNDSTDGLTGALAGLDFSKRKPVRERTLLSSINDVKVERVLHTPAEGPPVKVFDKNSTPYFQTNSQQQPTAADKAKSHASQPQRTVEPAPDTARDPEEFVALGGKGDQQLFDDAEGESRYPAGPGTTTLRAGAPPK